MKAYVESYTLWLKLFVKMVELEQRYHMIPRKKRKKNTVGQVLSLCFHALPLFIQ